MTVHQTIDDVSVTLQGEHSKKVKRLVYVLKQGIARLKNDKDRGRVQQLHSELAEKNQAIVVLKGRLDKLESELSPMRMNLRRLAQENQSIKQEMDKQQGRLITPAGGLIVTP